MRRLALLLPLATLVALAGCDVALDAPPPLEARYTLWGAFDPTADVQAVRVVRITDTLATGSMAPLPAVVRSVDLVSGAETAWADTVVVFSDGSVGHIYRAALRPAYGSRHLLTVTDPDGHETSALVLMPPPVQPHLESTVLGSTGASYRILWPGAPRLNAIRVRYELMDGSCRVFPYEHAFQGSSLPVEFGWQTTLLLREEAVRVRSQLGGIQVRPLRVTVVGEVASEDWRPPGGVFNPEILAEPGVMSNVRGGFGFVGAGYRAEMTWTPTATELLTTTFSGPGLGGC